MEDLEHFGVNFKQKGGSLVAVSFKNLHITTRCEKQLLVRRTVLCWDVQILNREQFLLLDLVNEGKGNTEISTGGKCFPRRTALSVSNERDMNFQKRVVQNNARQVFTDCVDNTNNYRMVLQLEVTG